ncbi:MAG: hypothetical protein MJZ41_08440 [Bacteroidaceae bacterium]|nr:hypothetical protein [Bacteroidaceae bacterium]
MKRKYLPNFIFLCFVTIAIASCDIRNQIIKSKLVEIDSLIYSDVDSAKFRLDEIKSEAVGASEDVSMYYNLLSIKIDSEKDKKFTSDSLVCSLADYYETNDPEGHLAESYYYVGRVNSDLKNGEKSLLYLHKALCCDSTMLTLPLKSRIYFQIGDVLMRNHLYEDAKNMQELALFYSKNAGDSLWMIKCKDDLVKSAELALKDSVDANRRTQISLEMQKIYEKVKVAELMKQNSALKDKLNNKGGVIIIVCAVALAVGGLIAFFFLKRRRNGNVDETYSNAHEEVKVVEEQHAPVKRQFYDKDINELISSRVNSDKILKSSDWKFIEERFAEQLPSFKDSLYELINLSDTEYHVCLLIKLEVAPSNMAKLMAMSNSSVSQIRLRLQHKVFDNKGTAKDWDKFVMSL